MRIHCFQHVPFEGMGCIGDWIAAKGHGCATTCFCDGDGLPSLDPIDWLIVMGGPMGVYETKKYPWLEKEIRFIEEAITRKKVVIGICLGAQLIAQALGARVYPNKEKEIGWFPLRLTQAGKQSALFHTFPETFDVFHWHGDTFDLPKEATRLAESQACLNQAFMYTDRVVGLQFHLEFTQHGVQQLLRECGQGLQRSETIQDGESMVAPSAPFKESNRKIGVILNSLETLFSTQAPS